MPKRMQDLPEEYVISRRNLAAAIGARVRLRREGLTLTQDQLRARMELVQVFVSRAHFSRVENGEALLNAAEIIALSKVLAVSYQWLLDGNETA